jgi:hypothetical protein
MAGIKNPNVGADNSAGDDLDAAAKRIAGYAS